MKELMFSYLVFKNWSHTRGCIVQKCANFTDSNWFQKQKLSNQQEYCNKINSTEPFNCKFSIYCLQRALSTYIDSKQANVIWVRDRVAGQDIQTRSNSLRLEVRAAMWRSPYLLLKSPRHSRLHCSEQ